MTNQELWNAVLGELELSLTKANFTTWFKSTSIASYDDGKVVIAVPNAFSKSWIEKKYHSAILRSLQSILQNEVKVIEYRVEMRQPVNVPLSRPQLAGENIPTKPELRPERPEPVNPYGLRANYTFENFIVGKGNELAHAAAQAVAANPGEVYNPLFVYGGVGLGKTHLLHAIGNKVLKNFPHFKPLYVTCEKFTNDFIHAVRSGGARDFKDRYRNVDMLLIDDIQFITGKEGTQEEFFHTFNALHQTNKHVILSSDRPPKAIPALEQRLLTRFEWGLMADISSPDLETRIAILEEKCSEKNFIIDKSIVQYIAMNVINNIRELESVLNKIIAYQELQHTNPSIDMVKGILSGFASAAQKRTASAKQIAQTIADFYDLRLEELMSQNREKRLAHPRQILMYLLREENNMSYPTIGREIGGRDHTTIMYACGKIEKELQTDTKLRSDIEAVRNKLYTQPIN